MRILFLLCGLLSLSPLTAQALQGRIQPAVRVGDTSQLHQVVLLDYSRLLGTVMAVGEDTVTLEIASVVEPVLLPAGQIRYIGLSPLPERARRPGVSGRVPIGDLTLLRTALPYPSRREFKTVMLLYNTVNWALNDKLQVGVGLAGPLGILASQRYRTSLRPWLHVGLSNEIVVAPLIAFGDDRLPLAGDLTTLITVGTADQFFTTGAGVFYLSDNRASPVPNFRLGMGSRLGRPTHLYAELIAYVDDAINEVGLLPSVNLSLTRRSHRWTFGLMSFFIEDPFSTPAPVPYVSYALFF